MGYNPSVSLDNLSANGIINYDANAFIYGSPLDQPIMASPYYGYPGPYGYPLPPNDSFIHHNKKPTNKTLLTILLGGLALIIGLNLKDKIAKYIPNTNEYNAKKAAAKEAAIKAKDKVAEKATEAKGFFKRTWQKFMEIIPWTESYKAKKAAEEAAQKAVKFKTLKAVGKYGGIGLAALAGLYAIFRVGGKFFGRNTQAPQPLQAMQQMQQPISQDTLNLTTPGSKTPEPSQQQVETQPPPQEQQLAQVQPVQTVQQVQTVEPVQVPPPVEQPQSVVEQPQIVVEQPQAVAEQPQQTQTPPPSQIEAQPPLIQKV